jgi:hypothetical protein
MAVASARLGHPPRPNRPPSVMMPEATVIKHLEHVYDRTGAHNRTQAVWLCANALDSPAN